MSCYLECKEGGSSKFWSCKVAGTKTVVTFGKIGAAAPLSQVKDHGSGDKAIAFMAKLQGEKLKKGYVVTKGGGGGSPKASPKSAKYDKLLASSPKASSPKAPPSSSKKRATSPGSGGSSAKKSKTGSSGSSSSGSFPVDGPVPDRSSYKVVGNFSIKLNQTNIGGDANNNKFYVIQLLSGKGKYACWTRWGRVGVEGEHKLEVCGTEDAGEKAFCKKFRDKTQNGWNEYQANKSSFTKVKGKYTVVETEKVSAGKGGADAPPLGKLSKAQIAKGQAVLDKLEDALKKKKKAQLDELSSQYYSLIPHNFGFKKPPAINNDEMLGAEQELLRFYLRMGFEDMSEKKSMTPISGVMDLELAKTLMDAAKACCSSGEISTCKSKGDDLAKKNAGKPTAKMGGDLYGAILLYTSNAIYQALNKALRDENRGAVKKYFAYLRMLLEAANRLPKKSRTLWRGIGCDLHSQYKVGSTITWWGVSSCTADKSVAQNFMNGCGGERTMLTVESKSAVDISDITFYSHEKESLLCPGTQLKVKSSKKNGQVAEITLQEVGRLVG